MRPLVFSFFILVFVYYAPQVVQATNTLDMPGVLQALAQYANDINALVALSPTYSGNNVSACAFPTAAQNAAISAKAAQLINDNFSGVYGKSYVVQLSNGVVTVNLTVGATGTLGQGPVLVNNSAQWRSTLIGFYTGFTGFFFSAPSHWLYSSPQVSITLRNNAFGGATTATVTLENESRGYICDGGVRKYQMIYNVFKHVFCYEETGVFQGDWKICGFYELNKAFLKMNANLINQQYP